MGVSDIIEGFGTAFTGAGDIMGGVSALGGMDTESYNAQTARGYLELAQGEAAKVDEWVGNYARSLGKTNLERYSWASKYLNDYLSSGTLTGAAGEVARELSARTREAAGKDLSSAETRLSESMAERGISKESGAAVAAESELQQGVTSDTNKLVRDVVGQTGQQFANIAQTQINNALTDPAFQNFYTDESGNVRTSLAGLTSENIKDIQDFYSNFGPEGRREGPMGNYTAGDAARMALWEKYGLDTQAYSSGTGTGWAYDPSTSAWSYFRNGAPVSMSNEDISKWKSLGLSYATPTQYQYRTPGSSYLPTTGKTSLPTNMLATGGRTYTSPYTSPTSRIVEPTTYTNRLRSY